MSQPGVEAALEMALQALEDVYARYVRTSRTHISDLIGLGLTPEKAEEMLGPIDNIETGQQLLLEKIKELAAA